jgi:hypothetical protein
VVDRAKIKQIGAKHTLQLEVIFAWRVPCLNCGRTRRIIQGIDYKEHARWLFSLTVVRYHWFIPP